jgi:3-oxoacyl-[acyl-carrier protein] reductase
MARNAQAALRVPPVSLTGPIISRKLNMFELTPDLRPDRARAILEGMATGRKAALVTGAASGIGRSAVLALARAGFDVAVNYSSSEAAARETAAQAQKAGARTLLLKCDVSDEAGVRAMVKEVDTAFGRLDVLINNAGTTAPWKPKDLDSLSLDDWDRVFAVNVRGLFQVTRACLPLLKKGEQPCIVNTASIVGLRPGPQPLPYAASKAAVVNHTKTLAWNLGPEIRVNAVAPGWMEGDWMKRMLRDKYDDLMGKRAKATPLKRVVTADDVAESMMSLIQGNRFVTGEVVVIDGGFASST